MTLDFGKIGTIRSYSTLIDFEGFEFQNPIIRKNFTHRVENKKPLKAAIREGVKISFYRLS